MTCRAARWSGRILVLLFAGAAGCSSDDLSAPATSGTLEVTTTTTGTEMDPDGYAVQVDGQAAGSIGTAATIRSDLAAGDHAVQLAGLAANCTVTGENPRTVSVTAGQTMSVTFAVTCGATSGGLQVSVSTTGPAPDADGYSVTVDGADAGTVGASAGISLGGVTAGEHEIGLSGVAANCAVSGDNPQTVTVVPGASATVAFAVTCSAPPSNVGSIRITTATTGTNPDPNGYRVAVDGGATQPIGVNASTTVSGVAAGAHQVGLTGLATNCSVQGDNPRSVTVSAGTSVTTTFTVQCNSGGTTTIHWSQTSGGTDFNLSAISGRGASDIFTTGFKSPGPTPAVESVVMHFDGASWSQVYQRADLQLNGVWVAPRSEVFAAGQSFDQGATLLHFDGSKWTETTVPQLLQGDESVIIPRAIWGSSPSDVFAVGAAAGSTVQAVILHYDGAAWSRMTVPAPEDIRLEGISGNSPRNVYAVGWSGDGASTIRHVFHFDGISWTSVYQAASNPGNNILQAVWSSSDGKVIAVATADALHYDGSSWSTKPLPSTTSTLHGVWGASATDVYGVGDGVIYQYDGTAWTDTGVPRVARSLAVWGSSAADVYAVGEGGVILHGTR
jgi:hypothetical protein